MLKVLSCTYVTRAVNVDERQLKKGKCVIRIRSPLRVFSLQVSLSLRLIGFIMARKITPRGAPCALQVKHQEALSELLAAAEAVLLPASNVDHTSAFFSSVIQRLQKGRHICGYT